MALQIRRGLSSQMTSSITPAIGEPIYTTDNGRLFIGDGNTTADQLTAINQAFATTDLSDVSSLTPTNDTFLKYDALVSQYVSTPFSLASLPEVDAAPTLADQVLALDGNPSNPTYLKLVPTTVNVSFLSDTNITSPSNGDSLVYNSSTGNWENQPSSGGTLASLTDVNLASTADGDMLIYSSGASQFINVPYDLTTIGDYGGFLVNAANDTAAASAGVSIGQLYRNGSVIQIRVT